MQKSFPIIIVYLIFLLLAYSNGLNLLSSEIKFQEFNQNDLKNEEEKSYNLTLLQ